MPIIWTTTSRVSEVGGVKVLVYSDSGMGKTLLCATAPRPVIISNESGLLCLKRANLERVFGVNTPGITYDIPVMQIQTVEDLNEAFNWFAGAAEAKDFDTACLDSISEMAETILSNAKRGTKDPRQAYGEVINQTEILVRKFRDLKDKHIYMAAKMEPFKDELTSRVSYLPAMPGAKLGPKMAYFFDEVFRLGINLDAQGKQYRFLQTQPDNQYIAKDRSGALDPIMVPHLGYIFQRIQGA